MSRLHLWFWLTVGAFAAAQLSGLEWRAAALASGASGLTLFGQWLTSGEEVE